MELFSSIQKILHDVRYNYGSAAFSCGLHRSEHMFCIDRLFRKEGGESYAGLLDLGEQRPHRLNTLNQTPTARLLRLHYLCVVARCSRAYKRASDYVKANDTLLGLIVSSPEPNSTQVHGLQCRFCIAFGRKEKVGAKRKPSSDVPGWSRSFRHDNIKNHVADQHPQK